MGKIEKFKDYRKLIIKYQKENKLIKKTQEQINKNNVSLSNAKEQITKIETITTPHNLLTEENEAILKEINPELHKEILEYKNEYLSNLEEYDKKDDEIIRDKQNEIAQQQAKQKETSDDIKFLLDKTNAYSVDALTIEDIEQWLETEQHPSDLDENITLAEADIEMHEANNQDHEDIRKDTSIQLDGYIELNTNYKKVHEQINVLSTYNLINKDFLKAMRKTNMVDYTHFTIDQIITEINNIPSLSTTVNGYPKWVIEFSEKIIPILFFMVGGVIIISFPDIPSSLSKIIVSLGALILNYLIPFLVGFILFRLLYYKLDKSGIKSFFISIIIAIILWSIIASMNITSGMYGILTIPILILLLVGVGYLGYMLNWYFDCPSKIEKYMTNKPILFKEERKRITNIIEENKQAIYFTYRIPEIIKYYSQQTADLISQERLERRDELDENLYLAQENWSDRIKETAHEYFLRAQDNQNYVNAYQSREDEINDRYNRILSNLQKDTTDTTQDILNRFSSNTVRWISIVNDYISMIKQHGIELDKGLKELIKNTEATASQLIHKGKSLFINDVSELDTKGQFPDVFFVNQSHQNNNSGIVEFQDIQHNQRPIVFLYDYQNNSNLAEKLYDFIQLLYQALFSVYPIELIDLIITDIQNHALNFKQQESLGLLSIINDIPTLSKKIETAMSQISTTASSIAEYNQIQERKFGSSATYKKQIISVLIIPDLNKLTGNQKLASEEYWRIVNNGFNLGYLPIFFVNKANWEDDKANENGKIINRIKGSYGDSKPNVYTIDLNNNIEKI